MSETKNETTAAPADTKPKPTTTSTSSSGYQKREYSGKKEYSKDDKRDYRKDSNFRKKFIFKRKFCRFCKDEKAKIDYKEVDTLSKFTKGRGKILPRRFTGNCAKHQRDISKAIKRSRSIALMPYVTE